MFFPGLIVSEHKSVTGEKEEMRVECPDSCMVCKCDQIIPSLSLESPSAFRLFSLSLPFYRQNHVTVCLTH